MHYPEDEFDRIGKTLPQGAHRPSQPWWHGFLPFVIVIIAAPLLAWALLLLIGSHPSDTAKNTTSPTPDTSVTEPAPSTSEAQTPAPEVTPSETPSEAPTSAEPSAPELDRTTEVAVLNASGVNGLAAKTKDRIAQKGYSKVTAKNFTGTKPRQNTIYFSSKCAEEAKEIQQILQIDMVVERADISGVQVVLVRSL